MTAHTQFTAMLSLAAAGLCPAAEQPTAPAVAEASAMAVYTAPLEEMFGIVEQINALLASAQDEESAEAAGEALQELLKPLDSAAVSFSSLPAPSPEVQAEIQTWFTEREHIMETMVQEVERLQNEDPAFFGSHTLITAIVYIGGILGGQQ